MSNIEKLSPEEERLPYSKYYYREPAVPNPKLIEILDKGPLDPSDALHYSDIGKLLEPGYLEFETGYCVTDEGVGYCAVNNVFPNCTVEMMKWWFAWHALAGLRYKIWYPPAHKDITVDEEVRKKILDPNIAIEDKYTNVIHHVLEDVGGGDDDIFIHFLKPEDMGVDPAVLKDTPVKATFGGFGIQESRANPGRKSPSVMLHACRETDDGVEFRSRFWMGCMIENGKPKCVLPPGISVPIEAPMGLAYHNVQEYSNLAVLLPEIFRDEGGRLA